MAVNKARKRAENYLLDRRMFRSLRTGEVIDKRWLCFSFPTFWHYDVLRGLDYLRNAAIKPDSRVVDAIETLIARRRFPRLKEPAPPSRSTSCGHRVRKATTHGWRAGGQAYRPCLSGGESRTG